MNVNFSECPRYDDCIKKSQEVDGMKPAVADNTKRSTDNKTWIDRQKGGRQIIYLIVTPILTALAAVLALRLFPPASP